MQDRVEKIRSVLKEKNLDAILVSSVSNIFYLTGISHFSKEEREAYVLFTKSNAYFFTTKLYIEEVQQKCSGFIFHVIGRDDPFVLLLKDICKNEQISSIGFEEHDIRYFEYHWISKILKNLSPLSLNIRVYKTANEIESIQKACTLGDSIFQQILHEINPGVTEKDLQKKIELLAIQHGESISFRPIVCFGANASMPHHESSSERKLQNNECILIDMGAKINEYCSDMTRTVFFGKPTDEEKKIYNTVLESQKRAIDLINKDVLAKDVDQVARDYILSQGYPSIPHSLGHGIGIEVHESPRLSPQSNDQLEEGMVFSIEPGIYIPNSVGVRIEDLIAIQNNEVKILTLSSKELICL